MVQILGGQTCIRLCELASPAAFLSSAPRAALTWTTSYSGGTIVQAGTLIVTNNAALPDGTSLTIGAGAALVFDPSTAAGPAVAVAGEIAVVPEPGTFGLLAAGAAMAGWTACRRKRRS